MALHALLASAWAPLAVGQATLAAALAAFEQTVEAAVRRCKLLLPEQWVQPLQGQLELVTPLLPKAREQLWLLQDQAGMSSSPTAHAALQASRGAQWAILYEQAESMGRRLDPRVGCDGCGREAEGLRRCSRCQRAHYCRWVRGWLHCRCMGSCRQPGLFALPQLGSVSDWGLLSSGRLPTSCCAAGFPLACLPPPVCSRECQVAHWAAHKRESQPA